mgnify:CR=1 FL=1|jgi:hypothetical protein
MKSEEIPHFVLRTPLLRNWYLKGRIERNPDVQG